MILVDTFLGGKSSIQQGSMNILMSGEFLPHCHIKGTGMAKSCQLGELMQCSVSDMVNIKFSALAAHAMQN